MDEYTALTFPGRLSNYATEYDKNFIIFCHGEQSNISISYGI